MEEFYDTNVDLIGWKEETGLVQMEKNVAECVYQMYTLYPSLETYPHYHLWWVRWSNSEQVLQIILRR